jgi:hypothetical protein
MTINLNLSVEHEEGRWNSEAKEAEPTWGWAVISLGTYEIARVELDYHTDGDRRDALEQAAARWLRKYAKFGISQCPGDPEETQEVGRRYDITAPSSMLDRLEPGVTVERELTAFTEEKSLTTAVPCCGRRITFPIYETNHEWPAVCCRCHVAYRVSLHEEMTGYDDELFRTALFAVESLEVTVARHRSGQ